MEKHSRAAQRLAAFYAHGFGGKASGRYRLSAKQMRELLGQKRVYPEDVTSLTRAALEEGIVLIDMDTFFVIMNANSFVNYRRLSADVLASVGLDPETQG